MPARLFASASDHAECRRLHRRYGSTYFFATRRLQPAVRRRVHALYGFVRVPDEWVDNPADVEVDRQHRFLEDYRNEFLRGLDGVRPEHPVVRAFCDVIREVNLPIQEPLLFLNAMAQDLLVSRYPTYDDLRGYMRGSAAAVGVMMCSVLEASPSESTLAAAMALGEAMQLTNFLRDIGEDSLRGRIYLPQEDLCRFNVREIDLQSGIVSSGFKLLMEFEIERARELYRIADAGIEALPKESAFGIKLARILYSRILDKIELLDFDVFKTRARTTMAEKISVLAQVATGTLGSHC